MAYGPPRSLPEVIAKFSPRLVSSEAAAFARAVVAASAPETCGRAKALLFASSRLCEFALSVGLEARPEVILHPSVIERFVLSAEMSAPTRRTVRTNLRHLARQVLPPRPDDLELPRERAKAPYELSEIAAYLALADAQPTQQRRRRAVALICLGAGAGLMGADLRHVRGTDLKKAYGGLVVEVGGRRPRTVPVLRRYHARLWAAAEGAGGNYLVGGVEPERLNVTSQLTSSLSGGDELSRLDTGRLRSSWLSAVAEEMGLRAFMEAAGLRCSQRLGDIVAATAPVDAARAVVLLGAAC